MMKIKTICRTVASIAAAAAAITAMSAAAGAEVIDFEDGNYDPYFTMKTNDGGDLSVLSVEEFNGSNQLKIDVQDCSLLPKLQIHLDKLVGSDHLSDIAKVQLELTIASKDGTTPPGWIGGDLGSESLDDQKTLAWSDTSYDGGEYEGSVAQTILVEHKWLIPSKAPKNGTEGITCLLQRWACDVPYYMYIDNVKLLDKDGNVLANALDAGAGDSAEEDAPEVEETPVAEETTPAAEEDAAVEETTVTMDIPAEETPTVEEAPSVEPVPVADTTNTTPINTGNTGVAAIAAVMAVAGAAAFISKRK